MVSILDYETIHQPWFEQLNRAWIEQYFVMEQVDLDVLQRPDEHIIAQGGLILMAYCDKEIAGTVALKKTTQPDVYEFTKMAVSPKFRGQKVGLKLAEVAIDRARRLGATRIILYSNSKLEAAISLYRKLGFVHVAVDGPYKRSDVKMELILI